MRAIQNWLDRFCYRHPRLGIPNLMLYIVVATAAVALFDAFSMGGMSFRYFFAFDRALILQGQVWRIFTFLFVPQGGNLFLTAISLYFYYFIASALEQKWGATKFTVYYLLGIVLNIILGFLIGGASIFYINMALFFAFATLYPDMQVLLFFILPIRIKWLAYFDAAFFLFEVVGYALRGSAFAFLPLVAILNYLLFFGADLMDALRGFRRTPQYNRRRNQNTVDFNTAKEHAKAKNGYLHKCAVCGKTDVSNPELEFRYCSKCKGYYCYCSEHIHSHIHVE